jgi:hypothetical protein
MRRLVIATYSAATAVIAILFGIVAHDELGIAGRASYAQV